MSDEPLEDISYDFSQHDNSHKNQVLYSFLSRKVPPRRLHECILSSRAYEFIETLISTSKKNIPSALVSDVADRTISSDGVNNYDVIKNKKMYVSVTTSTGNKLSIKVENMVMRIELKQRKVLSSKEIKEAEKRCMDMIVDHNCSQESVRTKEEINDPTSSLTHCPVVDNISEFIRSEKMKFYAYIDYMRDVMKDPSFKRTYEKHNVESTTYDDNDDVINNKTDDIDLENAALYDSINSMGNLMSCDDVDNENDEGNVYENNDTYKFMNSISARERRMLESYYMLPAFRINLQYTGFYTCRFGSQFNQRKFSSVGLRIFPLTINIFPYGRISSTGSTHEIASLLAFQQAVNMLREIHGPCAFEDPYVNLNNLVLSGSTGYALCIGLLIHKYPSYISKINSFSGISFINPDRKDKSTVLIFSPGTLCYTGAKSIESVLENMKILAEMLEDCRATSYNVQIEKNIMSSWSKSQMNLSDAYNGGASNTVQDDENECQERNGTKMHFKKRKMRKQVKERKKKKNIKKE